MPWDPKAPNTRDSRPHDNFDGSGEGESSTQQNLSLVNYKGTTLSPPVEHENSSHPTWRMFYLHQEKLSVNTPGEIEKCAICGEMIPKKQADEHYNEIHAPVDCSLCSETIERELWSLHKGERCPQRIVTCEYCEFPLPAVDLLKHQEICGNRTEYCEICHKYVRLRERIQHDIQLHSNQGSTEEPLREIRAPERQQHERQHVNRRQERGAAPHRRILLTIAITAADARLFSSSFFPFFFSASILRNASSKPPPSDFDASPPDSDASPPDSDASPSDFIIFRVLSRIKITQDYKGFVVTVDIPSLRIRGVKRHLRIRIEAHGKYLHSIPERACDAIINPTLSSNRELIKQTKFPTNEADEYLSSLCEPLQLPLLSEVVTESSQRKPFDGVKTQIAECSVYTCLISTESTEQKCAKLLGRL
ncbi:TRAF-type zinc finger domain-containing protein 1 [Canna indica]|uniref:TRAF-type zinc finger domain-containing protein 1 n=1 Tax=Canna indica TaxID=4628 RepID=A0AAQ3QJ61_9LILI|nr:TRAF-type zinc finger domain-containing protein 1 [Canna indica]